MMGMVMDPAARLGVPPDADAATIRAAFARRLRAVHPDIAGPGHADPGATSPPPRRPRPAPGPAPHVPRPHTGPVVFFQHRNLVGSLRAWSTPARQPRRHLS